MTAILANGKKLVNDYEVDVKLLLSDAEREVEKIGFDFTQTRNNVIAAYSANLPGQSPWQAL